MFGVGFGVILKLGLGLGLAWAWVWACTSVCVCVWVRTWAWAWPWAAHDGSRLRRLRRFLALFLSLDGSWLVFLSLDQLYGIST